MQHQQLEDLTGLVYDVRMKRQREGPNALLTYDEIATRYDKRVAKWQQQASEAFRREQQGDVAFANIQALEAFYRADSIRTHAPTACTFCREGLHVPHEWTLGAHVDCYADWNAKQLDQLDKEGE